MGRPSTSLAVAVHDHDGRMLDAIERLGSAIAERFDAVAVNATRTTDGRVLGAFRSTLHADVIEHEADGDRIGRYRRDAVATALRQGTDQILYSDADHLLRWIEARPDEVDAALATPRVDCLIVGRSPAAMAESPARLRETEAIVNHVYSLMRPGRRWDLMFAVRRLSRRAARLIVDECTEDSIANDVAWPLLVEAAGHSVDFVPADGLSYRTIHEFGRDHDTRDHDPAEWAFRVELAATHIAAMRPYF